MKLHSIIPSPSISNYVSKIFAMEDCRLDPEAGLPFIANGYPGFAFQTSDWALIANGNKKISNLFLFGQIVKPVKLYTGDSLTLIAYFFYPHVLKAFFGCDAKELTDVCIDLEYLQPAREMNLNELLINAASLDTRLQLMDSYVLKLAELHYANIPNNILFAARTIRRSKGLVSLKNVREELSVSERTFRRLFDFYIGVSPKMFGRICQFDAAFQQLNNNKFSRLSDVAYENGYADQSHLIRSFREFTNLSPSEYLRKCMSFLRLNQ